MHRKRDLVFYDELTGSVSAVKTSLSPSDTLTDSLPTSWKKIASIATIRLQTTVLLLKHETWCWLESFYSQVDKVVFLSASSLTDLSRRREEKSPPDWSHLSSLISPLSCLFLCHLKSRVAMVTTACCWGDRWRNPISQSQTNPFWRSLTGSWWCTTWVSISSWGRWVPVWTSC